MTPFRNTDRLRHGVRIESKWSTSEPGTTATTTTAEAEAQRTFRPLKVLAEGSPADRLRWLLAFIQLPGEVLQKHWGEISYEAAAFVYLDPTVVEQTPLEAVEATLTTVKNAMTAAVTGRESPTIHMPDTAFTLLPKWGTRRRKPYFGGLEVVLDTKDFVAAFLVTVKEAIEAAGDRLRSCKRESCRKLFVRNKRAIYCSQACSAAEQQRKFRTRTDPGKLSELRHRTYERKRRKEEGKKNMVIPRRRRHTVASEVVE
jgi:hypothetical protein